VGGLSGRDKPVHAPVRGFPVIDNELHVGGVPITRLAARVGSTPFFAYDRRLITDRVAYLRESLPAEVKLHYAIKANPMPAVVQHLAGLVDGFDVASAGELRLALDTPMSVRNISFAGPGKRDEELRQAAAAGVVVNLESPAEMERLARIGNELGLQPRVAVRVNPDFELKTSGMKMGGGPKPFGVDAERMPEMLARLARLGLEFWGFHIFSGSQNLDADALIEAQAKTLALAVSLAGKAPAPVRMVNIGGGFGIPYFPGDGHLDLADVGRRLGEAITAARPALGEGEIVIELGRYIVGEAGIYVARIVDRKESRGQVFLVTDGGLHHQLAASGNFGQVIRKNYPVAIGNKMSVPVAEDANVVGCLCTPLDRLGDHLALPRAEVGDLVVVFQSGAYGLSASPTAFLSHPMPVEILV
jgi:diaminopimelate decarboxylase